jgi:hypothetical protein
MKCVNGELVERGILRMIAERPRSPVTNHKEQELSLFNGLSFPSAPTYSLRQKKESSFPAEITMVNPQQQQTIDHLEETETTNLLPKESKVAENETSAAQSKVSSNMTGLSTLYATEVGISRNKLVLTLIFVLK